MSVIEQAIEDPKYFAKRNVIYATSKYTAHSVVEGVVPDIVRQVGGGAAAGLHDSLAKFLFIGAAAGISAGLTQMDYIHKKNDIAQWYKEELAAKLKKSPDAVTANDLDVIANGDPGKGIQANRVVAEEVGKAKKNRTFGIVFSFLATMASLAIVTFAMPAASPSLFHLAEASAAEWGTLLANTAVGVLAYNAVKIPLHWIGNKLFGLDNETTHERIVKLGREREEGKIISQEQVLSIFAKAHPELNEMIAAKYGVKFDELVLADKQRAVAEVGTMIPLETITTEINSGKVNVTELAFAVEGQFSGVHHEGMAALKGHGRVYNAWTRVRNAFAPHPKVEVIGMASAPLAASNAVYAEPAASGPSFVDQVGRPRLDRSTGYVKLVEQLDHQANAPFSQTIQ